MVKHHIENNTDAAGFRLRHQFVKIFQRTVGRIDRQVIRDVVAVINLRRNIERRQPDGINAQFLQIVEALRHAA